QQLGLTARREPKSGFGVEHRVLPIVQETFGSDGGPGEPLPQERLHRVPPEFANDERHDSDFAASTGFGAGAFAGAWPLPWPLLVPSVFINVAASPSTAPPPPATRTSGTI